MEEKGYIEVRVNSLDKSLKPSDVDISDIKSIISDIETFLYPTREDKKSRPHIAYDIQEGSAKHKFFLPISAVILFNGLTSEISKRGSLNFLDVKRQEVISKIQLKAIKSGLLFEFQSSLMDEMPTLIIDPSTKYILTSPKFVESEFYLYGEIYQEGGLNPNIHISTVQYGNLTVSATKDQIIQGEKKTYKPYGIKVKGKKSFDEGKVYDLSLVDFIAYKPVFDNTLLIQAIENAADNLSKIKDVDKWIDELRTEII